MSRRLETYVTRFLEDAVDRLLGEEPVVVLNGARTVGKSTLLAALAERYGARVTDLDDPQTRRSVTADPAFFASASSPVLVDEFQHVLELLDAIKAELNRDLRPGRFVLTGSTRYATLPVTAQSLTGRVHVVTIWPLSQGELAAGRETFLDRLADDPAALVGPRPSTTTREEYVERVLAGGLPLALRRAGRGRSRWYRDYVDLVVERDVLDIRNVRQREVLPKLLTRLAAQSGQVLNLAKAARAVDPALDASVAGDYARLLESVFLLHRLPAWGRTLRSRVASLPKVHLVDAGLGGYLLGLTPERVASRDPAVLVEFGHLTETFAVNEVLKQASFDPDADLRFAHFRTHDGHEVDLVVERSDERVSAVEVKAGSRVAGDDLSGLRTLRDRLGPRFLGGVVLFLGERAYTAEDRIHVVPMDRLWS